MVNEYKKLLSTPEQLAYKILNDHKMYHESNPFIVAKKLNINIFLMDLSSDLFSFYTKSDESNSSSSIINGSIPIQRIRYNLALDIYFHLTGVNNVAYYKNHQKTVLINKAKTFASCFLLPEKELEAAMKPYLNSNGKIKYSDIIFVANKMGVSFKTTAFRIFYKFHNIEEIQSVDQLRERIGSHITYSSVRKNRVPDYKEQDLKYIKQMVDHLTFLPTDQIDEIMKTKMIRDVVYGDLKTAENINFTKEDINQILANYNATGIVNFKTPHTTERILALQDFVQGQLDAYNFIYSPEAEKYADPEYSKYLMIHLHTLLFDKVNFGDFQAGKYVDDKTPERTVSLFFHMPKEYMISTTVNNFLKELNDLLAKRDSLSISEYIDESIKVFFTAYTSQMFNDGNSRVSKTLLNYLLHLKGIPSSFSVADSIREEYLSAIAGLGYDQRIRHFQETGSYRGRVIDKDGNIGTYDYNVFGYETAVINGEERAIEPDDKIEYYTTDVVIPAYLEEKLKPKLKEPHWEPLRELDFTPLQIVIYKAIMATYLDCLKVPSVNLENTQEIEKKK